MIRNIYILLVLSLLSTGWGQDCADTECGLYLESDAWTCIQLINDGIDCSICDAEGFCECDCNDCPGDCDDNQFDLPAGLISIYSVSVLDTDDDDKYKIIRRIVGDTVISEDTSP